MKGLAELRKLTQRIGKSRIQHISDNLALTESD